MEYPGDFIKILSLPEPGAALKQWLAADRRAPALLACAANISAGPLPFHTGSVLDHLARCMDETAGDPLAVWMAMCHDAGKLSTPAHFLPHHYGHEERGRNIVGVWARELGLPQDWEEAGKETARLHMKAGKFFMLRPGKKLRLLEEVGESAWAHGFWKVVDADTKSQLGTLLAADWEIMKEARNNGMPEDRRILLIKEIWQDRRKGRSRSESESE